MERGRKANYELLSDLQYQKKERKRIKWERRMIMCGGWSSTNDEKIICNKKSFMCRFNISYMNVHNVKVIYGHIFEIMNIFIHTAHTWNNFEKWDEDRNEMRKKFGIFDCNLWSALEILGYSIGFVGYDLVILLSILVMLRYLISLCILGT